MASVLKPITFNSATFRKELKEFENLLQAKANLSERDDILPFFGGREHLTAYLGALYLDIAVATELCFEFDITGNFRADLLLGSKAANQFCIVEFEPGEEDAIFKKQERKNPEWSSRFEHAFSQIVDWFWALEDSKDSKDFRATFGDGEIAFASLLVMGRAANLDDANACRIAWRTKKVLVDSNKVTCITFDELYADLKNKFEFYKVVAEVEKTTTAPSPPSPPS